MISIRETKEQLQSLRQSGDWEALAKELAKIPVLLALWPDNQSEVLELWEEVSQHGHLPEPYYRVSITELRKHNSELLPEAIVTVYLLLRERSNLDLPTELLRELLPELVAWAETHDDPRRLMQAYEGLSYISYVDSRYRDSQQQAEEAVRLAESLPDIADRAKAYRALGYPFLRLRRFEAARHCFEQQYHFAESIGDRSTMSNALGNTASVFIDEERLADAERTTHRQIALAESIGNTMEIVYAHMNLGIIYGEALRWDDAIETLKKGLELSLSAGNRKQATIILGNLGNFMVKIRRPEEGYPMLVAALDAHRDMGFPQGMTHWLESLAEMYCSAAFAPDYPPGFLVDFVDMAPGEEWRPAMRRMAWKYAEECNRLSRELKKYDTTYASAIVLARVETANDDRITARTRLEEVLDMLTDTLRISDCYAWLWRLNLGSPEEVEVYRLTALKLEEDMYKISPRSDLLAEIEELKRGEISGLNELS